MTATEATLVAALAAVAAGMVGVWIGGRGKVSREECLTRHTAASEKDSMIATRMDRLDDKLDQILREMRGQK